MDMNTQNKFKPLSAVLCLCFIAAALLIGGFIRAEAAALMGEWGAEGDNVSYTVDVEKGELNIYGSGSVADTVNAEDAPWYPYRHYIKTVRVGETVVGLYEGMFSGFSALETLVVPYVGDSIVTDDTLGFLFGSKPYDGAWPIEQNGAVYYVPATLDSVEVTMQARIPEGAFMNCAEISDVYLSDKITEIGRRAFMGCDTLTSLRFAKPLGWIYALSPDYSDGVKFPDTTIADTARAALYFRNDYKDYYWQKISITEEVGLCGKSIKWEIYDSGLLSIIGTGEMYDYEAGEAPWYAYSDIITEIRITDGVTRIGANAFYGCALAETVDIPEKLSSVGTGAFLGCASLTMVDIHDIASWVAIEFENSEANPLHEAEQLYINGELVTKLVIPEGVTRIGAKAFHSCKSITEIVLPHTLTEIGRKAFFKCDGLTKVTLPFGIRELGDYSFYSCASLSEINIPYSVERIGIYSFAICRQLVSVSFDGVEGWSAQNEDGALTAMSPEVIANSSEMAKNLVNPQRYRNYFMVRDTETVAYGDCGSNVKWVLDGRGRLTVYGKGAMTDYSISSYDLSPWYAYRDSITEIIIEEGVTYIGRAAFNGLGKAVRADIPTTVTGIGDDGFYKCVSMKTVNIKDIAAWCEIKFGSSGSTPVFYAKTLYLNGAPIVDLVIPEGVTTVSKNAFYACETLESVKLPSTLIMIDESAFYKCINLSEIEFSDSLRVIWEWAFGFTAITEIRVPDGVRELGCKAFGQCSALESVYIPKSVIYIGKNLIEGCGAITSLTLENPDGWYYADPETEETLGMATGLGDSVAVIGKIQGEYRDYYLHHVHDYVSTVFPSDCYKDGYTGYVCVHCGDSYTDEYIESAGHKYGYDYTCDECGYYELYIAISGEFSSGVRYELATNGVLNIYGSGAIPDFDVNGAPWSEKAGMITTVNIGDGVTHIGDNAFADFTSLRVVIIPDSVKMIGDGAFEGASGLLYVDLSETLIYIGDRAFKDCVALTGITLPHKLMGIGRSAFEGSGLVNIEFTHAEGWSADGEDMSEVIANGNAAAFELTFGNSKALWLVSGAIDEDGTAGIIGDMLWMLDGNGTLRIVGSGNMPDYGYGETPWHGFAADVTKIVIGEGITSVGRCAFYGFESAVEAVLPSTLTGISGYAFYGCSSLEAITIPENAVYIGGYAFRRSAVGSVIFEAPYGWSAGDTRITATEICLAADELLKLGAYKYDWVRDGSAVPEEIDASVAAIGMCNTDVRWTLVWLDEAKTKLKLTVSGVGAMPDYGTGAAPWYVYRDAITEIEVGSGITSIGRCAFYGLALVDKVTLNEGLANIGDYAFNTCRSLAQINIPTSVALVGKDAFAKTKI